MKKLSLLIGKIITLMIFAAIVWFFPLWYCAVAYIFEGWLAFQIYPNGSILESVLMVLFAPLVFALQLFYEIFKLGFTILDLQRNPLKEPI